MVRTHVIQEELETREFIDRAKDNEGDACAPP